MQHPLPMTRVLDNESQPIPPTQELFGSALTSSNAFTGEINLPLPAGDYFIGLIAGAANTDPPFAITFNTPVQGIASVPEPASFMLFGSGLMVVFLFWFRLRR
jgi:hypothetical protein